MRPLAAGQAEGRQDAVQGRGWHPAFDGQGEDAVDVQGEGQGLDVQDVAANGLGQAAAPGGGGEKETGRLVSPSRG
mgnify:CR=1 FL=1